MKILKKKAMIKRNQVNHIKAERKIMDFPKFNFANKKETSEYINYIIEFLYNLIECDPFGIFPILHFSENIHSILVTF